MSFILLTTLAITSCSSEEAAVAAGGTAAMGLAGILDLLHGGLLACRHFPFCSVDYDAC